MTEQTTQVCTSVLQTAGTVPEGILAEVNAYAAGLLAGYRRWNRENRECR